MIYDFIGKIKNVKKDEMLILDNLDAEVGKIRARAEKALEIKIVISSKEPRRDLLVKSKISVTSMPNAHGEELHSAISLFKFYMDEIEGVTEGDISRNEGFYNNDKTYSPLY